MEHAEAASLLTDLLAESLQPQTAAALRTHIEGCDECRGVSETYSQVRDELADHRQRLGAHPEPDALVAYATGDARNIDIRSHTGACTSCARELEILRRAGLHRTSSRRAWRWLGIRIPATLLRPAVAAVLLALMYPAYLGIVQIPRLRETTSRLDGEIQSLRREQAELRTAAEVAREQARQLATWGGGVQPLFLRSLRRDSAPAEAPVVHLASGQPALPVFIEDDRFGAPAVQAAAVEISIHSDELDTLPAWRQRGVANDLWSPEAQALVILVPASALQPGPYVLEAHSAGPPEIEFQGRFRIDRSPTTLD